MGFLAPEPPDQQPGPPAPNVPEVDQNRAARLRLRREMNQVRRRDLRIDPPPQARQTGGPSLSIPR